MIEVEDIDFVFPWVTSKIHSTNKLLEDVKNCRAVRAVRKTKVFIQNYPFLSLFMVLSITLGLLPFLVFLTFVCGSLAVILFTALTVFESVLAVAFALFFTVLLPMMEEL